MESKFSNDDYYAIYKEYKQKYLDLKNSVLEGGKKGETAKVEIKKHLDKLKEPNFTSNLNNYNNLIKNKKYNEELEYKNKKKLFDQSEYNRINNLLNELYGSENTEQTQPVQSAQGQTRPTQSVQPVLPVQPVHPAQPAQGQHSMGLNSQGRTHGQQGRMYGLHSLDAKILPSVTNNSVHGLMQSNRPTSSHFQTQNSQDYSIKVKDRFLIFDINNETIYQVKQFKQGEQNDYNIILNFLLDFRTFHQSNSDPERKEGLKIMSKQIFRDKLLNTFIKDAYIITITDDNKEQKQFSIRVENLNDTTEIKKLTEIIQKLESSLQNNLTRIMNDCYKLEEIQFPPTDDLSNDDVYKHNEDLQRLYREYKLSINNIKEQDINEIERANDLLKDELEKIRVKLNLNTYIIKESLNTDMTDTTGTVTVGNQNLLRYIKKEMGKQMEDGSMIFKIKDTDEDYLFAEFINKFRPYSSKNIAYLLLDFAISYKRYYNLDK